MPKRDHSEINLNPFVLGEDSTRGLGARGWESAGVLSKRTHRRCSWKRHEAGHRLYRPCGFQTENGPRGPAGEPRLRGRGRQPSGPMPLPRDPHSRRRLGRWQESDLRVDPTSGWDEPLLVEADGPVRSLDTEGAVTACGRDTVLLSLWRLRARSWSRRSWSQADAQGASQTGVRQS